MKSWQISSEADFIVYVLAENISEVKDKYDAFVSLSCNPQRDQLKNITGISITEFPIEESTVPDSTNFNCKLYHVKDMSRCIDNTHYIIMGGYETIWNHVTDGVTIDLYTDSCVILK